MAQTLMSQLVRYEKECCIYRYFLKRMEEPTESIAKHLGVTKHTVRSWKRRIREGEITCGYGASGYGECLHKTTNPAPNTP